MLIFSGCTLNNKENIPDVNLSNYYEEFIPQEKSSEPILSNQESYKSSSILSSSSESLKFTDTAWIWALDNNGDLYEMSYNGLEDSPLTFDFKLSDVKRIMDHGGGINSHLFPIIQTKENVLYIESNTTNQLEISPTSFQKNYNIQQGGGLLDNTGNLYNCHWEVNQTITDKDLIFIAKDVLQSVTYISDTGDQFNIYITLEGNVFGYDGYKSYLLETDGKEITTSYKKTIGTNYLSILKKDGTLFYGVAPDKNQGWEPKKLEGIDSIYTNTSVDSAILQNGNCMFNYTLSADNYDFPPATVKSIDVIVDQTIYPEDDPRYLPIPPYIYIVLMNDGNIELIYDH